MLNNARHEKFAQLVASPESAAAAYRKCYPRATKATAETQGPALLRKHQVKKRVQAIMEAAQQKADIGKEELIRMLVETLKAPPSAANMKNPLCEVKMSKKGKYATFMDKSAATDKLCRILGFYAADKTEIHVAGAKPITVMLPPIVAKPPPIPRRRAPAPR